MVEGNNNIFENAKFGDMFITRNGKPVIFSYISTAYDKKYAICLFKNTNLADRFELNGKCKDRSSGSNDIVARYKEEIDEDELEQLANEYISNLKYVNLKYADAMEIYVYKQIFKDSYRKAKGE